MRSIFTLLMVLFFSTIATGREYHVTPAGDDTQSGTDAAPLKTIAAAAALAQPGDTITVHAGVYRERVNPPRGGESRERPIIYQAAPGESVIIKGSERVTGWKKTQHDAWKVTIPNTFFGSFNPFAEKIHGDWFNPKGRDHHVGAVYLNEHWLIEAKSLEDVLQPVGAATDAYLPDRGQYLLNVAWFSPHNAKPSPQRIPAASFARQKGVQAAACSEGGECIGWIEAGDWACYQNVDFGDGSEQVEFRAASVTSGGRIELRLNGPSGDLLGSCSVPHTGGWQSWASVRADIKPTRGKQTVCLLFHEQRSSEPATVGFDEPLLWFAKVDATQTTIWAQFPDVDPNQANVEIHVRQSVFYPEKAGMNFITVRGFTLMQAATPWAPPTAEQIGLIGTHWSKGWIIENCDIRYSTCVGIALGKHGDKWDNTSADTAEGYVETIKRGVARGWSKQNIGHHIVRNNTISHCEQAGIVGSLGAVFSKIHHNEIHDIHVRRLFTGAEMAGIKIHAAIDTEISQNHIHRTCRGIWLDWMAQGARVTRNLLHDNRPSEDLFVEVNHGPFLVDNNLLLSNISLFDMSQGGAYVHNLFTGSVVARPELSRETPYHLPHVTDVAGLTNIRGGDVRFFNNIFSGSSGLNAYDGAALPVYMNGNVFLNGAQPARHEHRPLVMPKYDPRIELQVSGGEVTLHASVEKPETAAEPMEIVTTALLGRAKIPDAAYEQPDGSPYRIDTDYFGLPRRANAVMPGPFAEIVEGQQVWKVWPQAASN
jgi:alpha-N-arabinofuranosidase